MTNTTLQRGSGGPKRRQAEPYTYVGKKSKAVIWMDLFMVIMASGIAHGSRPTLMATIIKIIGWQRHAAFVYRVLLWYWASMLWSIDTCQRKVALYFTLDNFEIIVMIRFSALFPKSDPLRKRFLLMSAPILMLYYYSAVRVRIKEGLSSLQAHTRTVAFA